jgi:hypothetical protein
MVQGRTRNAKSHTLGSFSEGPLVTDAYLAALAFEHGCEHITTDSDSARFQGLRWRHPLGAQTPTPSRVMYV